MVVPLGTFTEGGEKTSPCIVTSKLPPCGPLGEVFGMQGVALQLPQVTEIIIPASSSSINHRPVFKFPFSPLPETSGGYRLPGLFYLPGLL